jgi:dihydrofolate reductase
MNMSIIVAVSHNNVIGKNNSLIWHLPADMKFFKDKTTGHCIITGRKNYESIPEKYRPLPNRTNIIVTRQKNYEAPNTIIVDSIEKAIEKAKKLTDKEIFIIGGGDIFKQSLYLANIIYLTKIDYLFEGDVFFPEINLKEWEEISRVKGIVNEKNKYPHEFIVYKKVNSPT